MMDGSAEIGRAMHRVVPSSEAIFITHGHVTSARHNSADGSAYVRGSQHWVCHGTPADPHLSLFSGHLPGGTDCYHAAGLSVVRPSSFCRGRRESRNAALT